MSALTIAEVYALPAVVDLRTACAALGIGKTVGYRLAREDRFPCRVLRVQGQYRVPTSAIWNLLGLHPSPALIGDTFPVVPDGQGRHHAAG